VQAAIELLDQVIEASRAGGAAADTLITRYFQTRRYAGSKDRRAVRDLVYAAIRRSGERPSSGRAALLGLATDRPDLPALFDGSPHGPAPIGEGEEPAAADLVPAWLTDCFDPLVGVAERAVLLERAPLDLRVNRLKGNREQALSALPEAVPTPLSPIGLRLPEGFRVEEAEAWRTGLVEVQDEGSQLLALACDVIRRWWLSICARCGRQDSGTRRRDGGSWPAGCRRHGSATAVAHAAAAGACRPVDRRAKAAQSQARGRGACRPARPCGPGAGRRALFRKRHLAAQSRNAMAAYPGTAGRAGHPPGLSS
jgi:hypothetical protein